MRNFIIAAVLVACSSVQAGDVNSSSVADETNNLSQALEMKCKSGSDERTLIVVPKGHGCELHYLKFGKSEISATSVNGQALCEKVRHGMRRNLEAAGFKCQ